MLHVKILNEVSNALIKVLLPLEKEELFGIRAEALARDHERLGLRVDLSKSASRLRRSMYAMWRSPLALHELVTLSPEGWGIRPRSHGPLEVGDLVLDQLKLMKGLRTLQGPDGKTLSTPLCLDLLTAILDGIGRATKSGPRDVGFNAAAVLWALHSLESANRVKKPGLETGVARFFKQWGLPEPSVQEVQRCVTLLTDGRFIADEHGKYWRLLSHVKFGF
jgi:hypothetical protein